MSSPGDLAPVLTAGLIDLGLELSPHQQGQLLRHLALIEQWNRVYNLTALRDPRQMLIQHLLDSLAVVKPLKKVARDLGWSGPVSFLDVGSGAGLPGVPLAVACPALQVTCIDTVGKKASFVQQVGLELGLAHFTSLHGRVEATPPLPWRLIGSRAFASLAAFTHFTAPLLADGGLWMAMKGRVPDDEIRELPSGVEVFHVEQLAVPGLNAERCVVWMRPAGGPGGRRFGTEA